MKLKLKIEIEVPKGIYCGSCCRKGIVGGRIATFWATKNNKGD